MNKVKGVPIVAVLLATLSAGTASAGYLRSPVWVLYRGSGRGKLRML